MEEPRAPSTQDEQPKTILAYKGFDSKLQCHGGGEPFQYEVGKTYEHKGGVAACESGFHACEHPLDVFRYYAPAGNRFAIVEQSGEVSRHEEDTKVASSRIHIKAEISFADLIKAAFEYTFSRAKPIDPESPAYSAEEQGHASATGYRGAASATGDRGAASATGDSGAASATGDSGAASATGYRGAASATGDSGAASATGDRGAASATGDRGAASATGDSGAASATGDSGAASATGDRGAASATGDRGAASATGYSGAASATGDSGAASATGDRGAASATGYSGAALASGRFGRAMGADGCAIFLVERDMNWKIVAVFAGIAGRDGIEPNTWYTLEGGKPIKVEG
jgi:hypothetical protein